MVGWSTFHSIRGSNLLPFFSLVAARGRARLFLFMGLMNWMGFILLWIENGEAPPVSIWSNITLPVMMISFVPYFLIMASGRLQVRENGIWVSSSLLRWGKIDSYRWENDGTLLVRRKGFFSWFPPKNLRVPPEHKQAVEELLAKHCPVQATA